MYSKETINKTERQSTEWKKIFANDVTNKGLISNTHKQLIQLNIKTNIKRWSKEKTIFLKENAYGQQAQGKMFNTVNHKRNANQNHSEILLYTCENGYHRKEHK